jgi:protein TonB
MYRVQLIAAPPGPRAVGVVTEAPATAAAPETPPKRAESIPKVAAPPKKKPVAKKVTARATPVPDARSARRDEPAPKAGGGPEGGKGTDVANVDLAGVEFPYPAYLQNIVRQIALRFKPSNAGALHAEVVFLIQRDGSVTGIRLQQRSGSMTFDIQARGAVEQAGNARAFGPLPDGWADDVLTVIFTFDPTVIR